MDYNAVLQGGTSLEKTAFMFQKGMLLNSGFVGSGLEFDMDVNFVLNQFILYL